MSEFKHTPAPWEVREMELHEGGTGIEVVGANGDVICDNQTYYPTPVDVKNARLIAAAPTLHEEMLRYLPILERAEADPEIWESLTEGTGIATANGYRAAIAKATGADHDY